MCGVCGALETAHLSLMFVKFSTSVENVGSSKRNVQMLPSLEVAMYFSMQFPFICAC